VLAATSALAAGMHEVAWARLLGRAVGHTTLGIGLALAAFMIGSGLGALLVARTPLWRRPRMGYALVEAVIGVGALGLLGYCLAGPLPSAALGGGLAVDVLVAGLVALLPAIGMGATYPLLVATAAESGASSVRALYAASLAGALVGTLLSALVTAPLFGLDGTGLAATVLNLAVAALAPRMLADGRAGPAPRLDAQDREALARFAAAGLIGLGAQAVWNRALLPYAGVSVLTFASIVAVYLAAQALGFALYARLPDRSRDTTGAFGMALAPALALLTLGGVSVVGDAMPDRDTEPLAWLARVFGVVASVPSRWPSAWPRPRRSRVWKRAAATGARAPVAWPAPAPSCPPSVRSSRRPWASASSVRAARSRRWRSLRSSPSSLRAAMRCPRASGSWRPRCSRGSRPAPRGSWALRSMERRCSTPSTARRTRRPSSPSTDRSSRGSVASSPTASPTPATRSSRSATCACSRTCRRWRRAAKRALS
jgi:hypothetical protein